MCARDACAGRPGDAVVDGSYLEDQDMWWLSGIFNDVSSFPVQVHIYDTTSAPTGRNTDAMLQVRATIRNFGWDVRAYTLSWQLLDRSSRPSWSLRANQVSIPAGEEGW